MDIVMWFIDKLLDLGLNWLQDRSVVDEIEECIGNTFDNISEVYPIYDDSAKSTFWDSIASITKKSFALDGIDNINKASSLENMLMELNNSNLTKEQVTSVCKLFEKELHLQIAGHPKVFNYVLMQYVLELPKKNDLYDIFYNITKEREEKINKQIQNGINKYLSLQIENVIKNDNIYLDRRLDEAASITDVLKINNKIMLLAEAGAGKTSYAQRIIFDLLNDKLPINNKIPVFISLSLYGGRKFADITEKIHNELSRSIPSISEENILQMLLNGDFFIVLDGLDEISNKTNYNECVQDIKNICKYYNNNYIFITCRSGRYNQEFNDLFEYIKLSPLHMSQIIDYFYIVHNTRYNLKDFHYELFKNPLFLKIGARVIEQNQGKLPLNKTILFDEFVKYSYDKWNKEKGTQTDKLLSLSETKIIFSVLAYNLFEKAYMEQEDIERYIIKEFPKYSCTLLLEELINTGLIIRNYDDSFEFFHKTFKEYFAAVYLSNIIKINKDFNCIKQYINNPIWHGVIHFLSGTIDSIEMQNKFLDFIMNRNLKLYISSLVTRNRIETSDNMSLEEYTELYLKDFLKSYKGIVKLYFDQISSLFIPKSISSVAKSIDDLIIFGNISHREGRLTYYFSYRSEKHMKDVNIISEEQILSCKQDLRKELLVFSIHSINLSSIMYFDTSARYQAIKRLKNQIDDIIKKGDLNESPYMICDKLRYFVDRNIETKSLNNISDVEKWAKDYIDKNTQEVGKTVKIQYGSVDVTEIMRLIGIIKAEGINYYEYLLPEGDIDTRRGLVTDFYSQNKYKELVEKFLYYMEMSFKYMVEHNFKNLGNQMPDYNGLPFQYHAYIVPHKGNSVIEREYWVTYFYEAVSSMDNDYPIVCFNNPPSYDEIHDRIAKSFIQRGYLENGNTIHTVDGSMMFLISNKTNRTALIECTYNLLQENIDSIFDDMD